MQLVAGDPSSQIPVVWYFAPPGAKSISVPSNFRSLTWNGEPLETFDLGEQGPRGAYYNGNNPWGYTGECTVGSDDQWLNGLTAAEFASPGPMPACCRPPLPNVWYLRPELPAVQRKKPGGWFGSWDATPLPAQAKQLSTQIGALTVPFYQLLRLPATSQPFFIAELQFLTPPLPNQTIPAGAWQIGLCAFAATDLFTLWSVGYWLTQLDANYNVKAQIFTRNLAGTIRPGAAVGGLTFYSQPTAGQITVAIGDVFCLEIGVAGHSTSLTPYSSWAGQLLNSGPTAITANHQPNATPASFLAWPTTGAQPALLLESGSNLLLQSGGRILLE